MLSLVILNIASNLSVSFLPKSKMPSVALKESIKLTEKAQNGLTKVSISAENESEVKLSARLKISLDTTKSRVIIPALTADGDIPVSGT